MKLVRHPVRTLSVLFGSLALAVAFTVAGAGTASAAPNFLRVGCGHHSFPTIGAAVNAAASGATIIVCPGTYPEDVMVSKTLSIVGIGHPVINAANRDNGFLITASGSRIQGFTVENAIGEGILVGFTKTAVSDVTIRRNTVKHNDQGNPNGAVLPSSSYPQCAVNPATPLVPGDCGEGIHLVNTFDSTVVGNTVFGNSGGVLLSDDTGATYGNLIEFNDIFRNVFDCGVTLAGHLPAFAGGGVHDNTILGNRVTGNGVRGEGAGVIFATGAPGGAVNDNHVVRNFLAGNGLGGVTLHAHAPGENLTGNTITGNVIGTNNLDPDHDFGPPFDVAQATGVVIQAESSITITVAHNLIFKNVNGIWLAQVPPAMITAIGTGSNQFISVTNHIVTVS